MEWLAAFPDGEWNSIDRMFSNEELDFTQEILHQFSYPLENDDEGLSFINPSSFCLNPEANMSIAGVNESFFYSSNALDSNFHYYPQESRESSNSSGSVFVHPPKHETYFLSGSNQIAVTNDLSTDSFLPAFPSIAMEETVNIIQDLRTDCSGKFDAAGHPAANAVLANELSLEMKSDVLELHASYSSENTKKRTRVSKDAAKVYKNVQNSKKSRKINLNGIEGESNNGSDGQSSSTTSSSEDDNVSQDVNGVETSDSKASQALNLNGKTRASRGSAIDPQSLYARKRRERINERLRVLQNLVPNGTKVDISTMLEEAVNFVKFLQLQIKLLSSDDLWMYAPLAYNGIDIGLNKKISTLL